MKAVQMMVVYGANKTYVASHWVAENAVEGYKTYWMNQIRNIRGWKKAVNFLTNKCAQTELAEENDKPMGYIFGYTNEGFKTIPTK